MARPKLYLLELFALVPRPHVGCWVWPFSKNGAGRAMFGGRSASRLLYQEIIGPLPDGIGVLHSCDNPACVRPDHWFPGDQMANMADAIKKGRFKPAPGARPGERHHLAKLSRRQATKIKKTILAAREANGGWLPRGYLASLEMEYSISRTQLCRIATGERWGHIQ